MRYQINLLPPKDENLADKLIYFSFHYLRYILVITQLVVICVFFYRFRVDQDIIDLKDTIKQKQEIIETVEPMLKEVRVINGKITHVKTVLNKQEQFDEIFTYFLTNLPSSLKLSSIKFGLSQIQCEGVTESVTSVKMFYEKLLKDNKFANVQLSNVRKEATDNATTYTFTLKLEGFKYKNEL